MPPQPLCVCSFLRPGGRWREPSHRPARRRLWLRPEAEVLESRLALSGFPLTYVWTALGDRMSWNDANNWSHSGAQAGVILPGTPTAGADIVFPPIATLPAGSPATINFNANSGPFHFPIHTLTIQDSFTFQGNPISIDQGVFVLNPFGGLANATILLGGLTLDRGASIFTERGSTLNLANGNSPTSLQLVLMGSAGKSGGGQLVINTQNVLDNVINGLHDFNIAGGSVALGTSVSFAGTRFFVDAGSSLNIAANSVVKVGSIGGSGIVNLQGTTSATDQTSLTATVPGNAPDRLTGSIQGVGRFIKDGNGTLAVGDINLGDTGSVQVLLGKLGMVGTIRAGTLQVGPAGTFGGLGSWQFSGSATFQARSTFDLTLKGLDPGTQYTQLIDADTRTGIDLGNSTLSGTVGYQYQAGDTFTIAVAPRIQGPFQNVVNGTVLLAGNVPFAVSYTSTAVTLTALQSVTTTRLTGSTNPSHPGEPVSFTATVRTRTAPATTGTVSFQQGTTVLATIPVTDAGTATFTTAGLPLGSTAITAVYSGAAELLGSTAAAWTQAVIPYSTMTQISSSANPSKPGQPVTFMATVLAAGKPVTSGTVTFTRRNQVLGTVALGGDGTARLTIATLPAGTGRIQAIYNGVPEDLPSLSPVLTQTVARFTTMTRLALQAQARPNGRVRLVLVATVTLDGATGPTPAGTVTFRRNGHAIGRVQLSGGTAVLSVGRRLLRRGTFRVAYQGGSLFVPSTSGRMKRPRGPARL